MLLPPTRPLIDEIEQLRRSVDSMNSQTAEMLKNLENLRNIGADHIALPSTDQEKLDREWEYFETVCDQVYFILENAKYKLKRQQDVLHQQLRPPPPEEKPLTPAQTIESPTTTIAAPESNTAALAATVAAQPTATSITDPSALQEPTAPSVSGSSLQLPKDNSVFDLEMLSPPSNFEANSSSDQVSTANFLSAPPVASEADSSLMDDTLVSEVDKLQDTMLDLGDIGNLGDNLGDMDDMINF